MRQLREPEAVIAIVDDDPSVRRELQRLIGSVGSKPETLSIFSVMPDLSGGVVARQQLRVGQRADGAVRVDIRGLPRSEAHDQRFGLLGRESCGVEIAWKSKLLAAPAV